MSSSPTITQLYDDDDSPTEDQYEPDAPPDIRVVSQSQTTDPFDHLLNAVALRVEEINSPHPQGMVTQLEAYTDDAMDYQVPASTDNLVDAGKAQSILSPVRKSLFTSFQDQNKSRKRDGSNLVDYNKRSTKKKKVRVKPFTSICGFLRDDAIERMVKELERKDGEMTVHADIKSALTFWHNKRVVSYAPFDRIQGLAEPPPH
jgi:hypothetical protein